MALIDCPECFAEVSDSALKCPKCGVQLRKMKRGFFGKLFKFSFIAFNILMLVWAISYFGAIGEMSKTASSNAAQTGVALGAAFGSGVLLFFLVSWRYCPRNVGFVHAPEGSLRNLPPSTHTCMTKWQHE